MHASEEMRAGLKKMGLKFLLSENDMCSFLTTVLLPKHLQIDELKRKMREKNIVIYDGKGPLKGKVFQVGNVGELSKEEIDLFLESLEEILQKPHQFALKQSNQMLNHNIHIAG